MENASHPENPRDALAALGHRKITKETKLELVSCLAELGDGLSEALLPYERSLKAGLTVLCHEKPEICKSLVRGMLHSEDPLQIADAIDFAAVMGDALVADAIELIDDADPSCSSYGARILALMINQDPVPVREALSVPDPSKRALAVLMEHDPDALSFFEDRLADMLGQKDQILQRYAIDAAISAGDYVMPLLLKLIGEPNAILQQNATNALIGLGELAVPDLVDELDSLNPIVQQNATRALTEIGVVALPDLEAALSSDSQLQAQNAGHVIRGIRGPKAKRGLSVFGSRKAR